MSPAFRQPLPQPSPPPQRPAVGPMAPRPPSPSPLSLGTARPGSPPLPSYLSQAQLGPAAPWAWCEAKPRGQMLLSAYLVINVPLISSPSQGQSRVYAFMKAVRFLWGSRTSPQAPGGGGGRELFLVKGWALCQPWLSSCLGPVGTQRHQPRSGSRAKGGDRKGSLWEGDPGVSQYPRPLLIAPFDLLTFRMGKLRHRVATGLKLDPRACTPSHKATPAVPRHQRGTWSARAQRPSPRDGICVHI